MSRLLRSRSGTESPRSLDNMRSRQVSSPMRTSGSVSVHAVFVARFPPSESNSLISRKREASPHPALTHVPLIAGFILVRRFRRRGEPQDRSRNVPVHVPGHRLHKDDAPETQASPSGGILLSFRLQFHLAELCMSHISFLLKVFFFFLRLELRSPSVTHYPTASVTLPLAYTRRAVFLPILLTRLFYFFAFLSSSFLILHLKSGENDFTRVRCIDFSLHFSHNFVSPHSHVCVCVSNCTILHNIRVIKYIKGTE